MPQRIKTLTFDDQTGHGMSIGDVQDIAQQMIADGVPADALLRVETLGQRGDMKIGSLTASDRPALTDPSE